MSYELALLEEASKEPHKLDSRVREQFAAKLSERLAHPQVPAAPGDVACARGRTEVARSSGVTRDAPYKILTKDGDPRLSAFLGAAKALGSKIQIAG